MHRFVSVFGLCVMIGLAWLMSSHKRRFPTRIVLGGLLLQFALAALILLTPYGRFVFEQIGVLFTATLAYVDEGSAFLFDINPRPNDDTLPPAYTLLRSFAFGVLPTIVFFSSLMTILYHLGVMQWVVRFFAVLMQWSLGTSGAESLSAAANIFVGQTEAPLVIRPYVSRMTMSELMAVMVGGFATIAGGVLAAYVSMGIDAGHLITASVISAPAALLIAKVMQPEVDEPKTLGVVTIDVPTTTVNVIEAAARGASDGLKLALNVGAMLLVFVALVAMINGIIGWIGLQFGFVSPAGEPLWQLETALGYLFAPLAWVMGVDAAECQVAGQFLGVRTVLNEFVAYAQLGAWIDDPPEGEALSERTVIILTYALSGFANFSSIGIQLGGIGGIAPERRSDLAMLGLRAMLGGTLATFMTACVAGILI